MRTGAFVDSAAFIALMDERDFLHPIAMRTLRSLRRVKTRLVTTEWILIEVANSFSNVTERARTIATINDYRDDPELTILKLASSQLESGWDLYSRRTDKDWSWTDCISFVIMEQQGLETAFTSDHHFIQAGFKKLM